MTVGGPVRVRVRRRPRPEPVPALVPSGRSCPLRRGGERHDGHCYVVVAPAVQGVADQDAGAVQRPCRRRRAARRAAISSAASA